MFNKYSTSLYAVVISSLLVASVFAISFVQQALAQGNQTSGAADNQTSGAAGSNRASGNATSGGTAANPGGP
jgi:hypothetical protein